MATIRQHGSNNELFDIASFLPHIDKFFNPDTWHIKIRDCLGEGAEEIERVSFSGISLSDSEFRSLYKGIYQTVDGQFIGVSGGNRVFYLEAVDSSFWQVTGPTDFESHMLSVFGNGNAPN